MTNRTIGISPQVYARSAALAHLVLCSASIAAALSRLRTQTANIVCAAAALSVVAFIQARPIAALLHLTPLSWLDLLSAAGIAVAIGLMTLALYRKQWSTKRRRHALGAHAA